MGYVFLGVALLAGITKAYCGKRTSGYIETAADAMRVSTLRMFFCVLIGTTVLLPSHGGDLFSNLNGTSLIIAFLSGLSTAVFVVCWILSVKQGAYMLVEIFVMLGVVVPLLLSHWFFGETVTLVHLFGVSLLVLATWLMFAYNRSIKQAATPGRLIVLAISGLANGMVGFSQKWFVSVGQTVTTLEINLLTYFFSFVLLSAALPFFAHRQVRPTAERPSFLKKATPYILLMSVCLLINSYCLTEAAALLEASRLYPLNQGGALLLSTSMSAVCFGEKITKNAVIGIVLAFAGLIVIHVL